LDNRQGWKWDEITRKEAMCDTEQQDVWDERSHGRTGISARGLCENEGNDRGIDSGHEVG